MKTRATGKIVKAFGNLLHVAFEGNICQGEIAMIDLEGISLKAEVIEIIGTEAKLQVFEDTRGVKLGTYVEFSNFLLDAELGPGLLTSIFDGLQNPLEHVANASGLFLTRGTYLPALDYKKHWDYHPTCQVGDVLRRGEELGYTLEGRFHHSIMVPFTHMGKYKITWVVKAGSYPIDTVVAKAEDKNGNEISFTMVQKWPVKNALFAGEKVRVKEMMDTGLRILDTQFPVVKGGSFCVPGPFGAGKTVLQHHLSKYSSVDIVIVCACGERAGEVVEVLRTFPHLDDPHTNEPLLNWTVIICNTSSMPVSSREASIYMGATIAEYYRQMGLDVLLLADSTSRWAQALREMSGRLEEIPGEEAFPAYLSSRIAAFYERSGVVKLPNGKTGSLTIGGTVSPAGGNFEEPVTQSTLAVVGAFHGLSRSRSDARRFPSIDPLISWSKYTERVGAQLEKKLKGWGRLVRLGEKILREGDDIGKRMEVVGEEGISIHDMVIFLALQNEIKNMNFMPFESEQYHQAYSKIEQKINKQAEK